MTREQELRRLVNGEANARLSAQVALMCSSDARATGLIAASATIAGLALTAAFVLKGDANTASFFWACLGTASTALLASFAALWAIWPTAIEMPGWKPSSFEQDWHKQEAEVIHEMLPFVHDKIEHNDVVIFKLYRRSLLAMCLLALCPVGGLAGGLLRLGGAPTGVGLLIVFGFGWLAFLYLVPERHRTPR